MAPRLTDKQKKKIIADYLETESYNATAKLNGVADTTVKRVVQSCGDFMEKAEQKKGENDADIAAYMDSKRDRVCEIIEIGLDVLPEKIIGAKTASEVTTALGTLIDKWGGKNLATTSREPVEDDPLTKALRGRYGDSI